MLKKLVADNRFFFIPYLLFIISGAIVIVSTHQSSLHLFFNQFHNRVANHLFYSLTFLGDGLFAIIACLILLFIRYRIALTVFLSTTIGAIIAQSLKRLVFNDYVRPAKYFEGQDTLYLIPGFENDHLYSFPSGHTTTAFALYLTLAFFTKNNLSRLFLFIVAIIVSYSRVYLSQHFFEDIYAGAMVGVFSAIVGYWLSSSYFNQEKLEGKLILQKRG